MPHMYGFSFLIYTICRYRIPAFSGKLQQQEVHCQHLRAACHKPWRIDVSASCVLVRSRIDCGVSANVWKTNGRYNLLWLMPSCQLLQLRRQRTYTLLRAGAKGRESKTSSIFAVIYCLGTADFIGSTVGEPEDQPRQYTTMGNPPLH